MAHLEYLTVIRFCKVRQYRPKDLAEYLYEIAAKQDIDDMILSSDSTDCYDFDPIISIHCRQQTYASSQKRALGDHFKTNKEGRVIKFEPSGRDIVRNLRFLSALFGRNMTECAAADGVRYQFDGPHDVRPEIGWVGGRESLVQV